MEDTIIITSGNRYLDIDAYASCIAYANLLKNKGKNARAISTANLNESITETLIKLPEKLDEFQRFNGNEKFIILDVSNSDFFDYIVDKNNIIEIMDHHYGYEEYWNKKLKEKSHIEKIGAIATLIFEMYEKEEMLDKISSGIARLLVSAILDNTLNFKSEMTTLRDINAYNKLLNISNIQKDYAEEYFKECQDTIIKDLESSIRNDTKIDVESKYLPKVFGQLTLWNVEKLKIKDIYRIMNQMDKKWMVNIISLEEGCSYIICDDIQTQNKLQELFESKFINNVMRLKQMLLRKEIIKKAIQKENQ